MAIAFMRYEYQLQIIAVDFIAALLYIYITVFRSSEHIYIKI